MIPSKSVFNDSGDHFRLLILSTLYNVFFNSLKSTISWALNHSQEQRLKLAKLLSGTARIWTWFLDPSPAPNYAFILSYSSIYLVKEKKIRMLSLLDWEKEDTKTHIYCWFSKKHQAQISLSSLLWDIYKNVFKEAYLKFTALHMLSLFFLFVALNIR